MKENLAKLKNPRSCDCSSRLPLLPVVGIMHLSRNVYTAEKTSKIFEYMLDYCTRSFYIIIHTLRSCYEEDFVLAAAAARCRMISRPYKSACRTGSGIRVKLNEAATCTDSCEDMLWPTLTKMGLLLPPLGAELVVAAICPPCPTKAHPRTGKRVASLYSSIMVFSLES